jgi:hypothetical protein
MGGVLMADTLLQNLTELTSPATTDLLYMVADPAGTPADRKVQFSTVLDRAKGYSKILDASGRGDYTSLSTALAALSAGDVLFIRNGTYTGGVTVSTAEVTIIGETRNGVIIQSPANNSTPCFTISAAKVTLQNVKIDGQRDTQGTGNADTQTWSGIHVTAGGVLIDNVWVFEPYGNGISASADDGRITNCLVENRATDGATPTVGKYMYGMVVYGGSRWTIAYNRVTGWSQACGLWWGCSDNIVAFNRFIANYGYLGGVGVTPRSAIEDFGSTTINYRNLWLANLIDGAIGECIECAQGVIGSQFVSNICRNSGAFSNPSCGIVVVHGTDNDPTYDIILRDNTFIGNAGGGGLTGINANGDGVVLIEGNSFVDCQRSGTGVIEAYGADMRLIARNNSFHGCTGQTFLLSAQQPALIDGNTITGPTNTAAMIYVSDEAGSTRHVITNNRITGAGGHGIYINGPAGAYSRIENNTLDNASLTVAADYCIVTRNHVTLTNYAVQTAGSPTGIVIEDNTVVCNSGNAIYLASGLTHSIIQNNRLIGSSAGVNNASGNATNQVGPNHAGTFSRVVGVLKALGAQTVGATQATIAHGLAYTPTEVQVTMTSAGTIWKSAASDGTNIYLTADDAGRTAEIFVR